MLSHLWKFLLYFIVVIVDYALSNIWLSCAVFKEIPFLELVIWSVVENLPEDLNRRAILIVYWFAKVYCLIRLDMFVKCTEITVKYSIPMWIYKMKMETLTAMKNIWRKLLVLCSLLSAFETNWALFCTSQGMDSQSWRWSYDGSNRDYKSCIHSLLHWWRKSGFDKRSLEWILR